MIEILGFEIRLYGVVVALAMLAGTWVCAQVAKRERVKTSVVWDGLVWMVVPGLIGARLYHVVDLWGYYSQNLLQIVAVWNGGLGIFGALIGGLIGLLLYWHYKLRKRFKKSPWWFVDLAVLGLPLAQAIGRWGNYLNQELYGPPTSLPWGIYIDMANRLPGFEQVERFHPLFLYESLLSLIVFAVLMVLYQKPKWLKRYGFVERFVLGSGKFVGVYLVGYGVSRFLLEFVRLERWSLGAVPVAQIVSVAMVGVGVWLIMRGRDPRLSGSKRSPDSRG